MACQRWRRNIPWGPNPWPEWRTTKEQGARHEGDFSDKLGARTPAALLRNFISFYHQTYRTAVWWSRHNYRYSSGEFSRPYCLTLSLVSPWLGFAARCR